MKSGYIAIVGRPNSGKSTLLNKILGERLSIVTHKAQTTRHRIVGIHNTKGAQMIFLDTPGIHESEKELNKYMMGSIEQAISDADVVCLVVDVREARSRKPEAGENKSDPRPLASGFKRKNVIYILNKIDLILDQSWLKIVEDFQKQYDEYETIAISAKTGFGVEELVTRLKESLPEGECLYPDDIYTEHPMRFLAAELIREQVFLLMHDEVPYSVAVEIEGYKEKPKIDSISAAIVVEKESQKAMVIGKGGQMIKKIGESARLKIEEMTGKKAFLKLFVKVEKNWTKDPKQIKALFNI